MFRFRGQRKDNGEWVVGRYIILGSQHYIYHYNGKRNGFAEIHPHTLSISTGKLDSNKQEIFASFPIDGVMTTGGDVVRIKGIYNRYDYSVYYKADACTFCLKCKEGGQSEIGAIQSNELTIIGKQGGWSEREV